MNSSDIAFDIPFKESSFLPIYKENNNLIKVIAILPLRITLKGENMVKIRYWKLWMSAFLFLLLLVPSITPSTGMRNEVTVTQSKKPLKLALIWHQHQPNYQDPSTGIYEQPWVLMHSSNSYPLMAKLLELYPINATINLTPVLLRQLDDYTSGVAFDRRIEVAKMDESSMSFENKSLVITHFFDINPQFVTGRYKWIQDKLSNYHTLEEKVAALTNAEYYDLKVMFFLRWINPYFIYNETLHPLLPTWDRLIDEGDPSEPKFSGSDKINVINVMYQIAQNVVPWHKTIRETGRVEITTTPYYHPILPLLIDLNSARETDPGNAELPLPTQSTGWVEDAQAQINKGVQSYVDHFNGTPNGMWPSEEAVSSDIIPLVANAGINWIVTDEGVLRRSLGVSSTSPEQLYKMYRAEKNGSSVAVLFRDPELSNQIGFTYSGMDPNAAAADFVTRLKNIYNSLPADNEDYIVTVALDGENAWEYYSYDIDGDGKNEYTGNLFRVRLYQALLNAVNEGWLETVTPTQYLASHPINTLPSVNLATGSWAWDLNTWIGEPDENVAWDRLITARKTLVEAENNGTVANSTAAWEALYAAEGSDWFWWYGTDQNSGHDEVFDWGFKTLLRNVYENIGWSKAEILQKRPELYLKLKPIYSGAFADRMDATFDGVASSGEWASAYWYNDTEINDAGITSFYTGIDQNTSNLLFRVDFAESASAKTGSNDYVAVYFNNPNALSGAIFPFGVENQNLSQTLGFELFYAVVYYFNTSSLVFYTYDPSSGSWDSGVPMTEPVGVQNVLEFAVSISRLNYDPGPYFLTSVRYTSATGFDVAPQDGPIQFQIPLGGIDFTTVFSMDDPEGDEYGIYPWDESFDPGYGLFDILHFEIGYKENQLIATIKFRELTNPWNSPRGFSHPLIHIYFDQDRVPGSGATYTAENANADIDEKFAWESMIKIDGWEAFGMYDNGTEFQGVDGFGDSLEKTVTITAPLDLIGGTPTEDWAYVVIVGSQDFSNFREVLRENGQWKFGGGDDGPYDPNVIDILLPETVNQQELLTSYDVANQQRVKLLGVGPKVNYVEDTEPPVVTITSPADGTIFDIGTASSIEITLEFTVTDNVKVDHIDVFVDNILEYDNLPGNTTKVSLFLGVGNFTLRVNAFDGFNEETANFGTDAITVSVRGNPPATTTTPGNTQQPSSTTKAPTTTTEKGGFLTFPPLYTLLIVLVALPIITRIKKFS